MGERVKRRLARRPPTPTPLRRARVLVFFALGVPAVFFLRSKPPETAREPIFVEAPRVPPVVAPVVSGARPVAVVPAPPVAPEPIVLPEPVVEEDPLEREANALPLDALVRFWLDHDVASVDSRLAAELEKSRADDRALGAARRDAARKALAARRVSQGLAPVGTDVWAARFLRARDSTRANPLVHRGADGKSRNGLVATRLDASGFAIASAAHRVEATWAEEPALGLALLARARRPGRDERARDLLDDARLALSLGRYEDARVLFLERTRLVKDALVPDVEKIRKARPFPGPTRRSPEGEGFSRLTLDFPLDVPGDAEAFTTIVQQVNAVSTHARVEKHHLRVSDAADGCRVQTARVFDVAPGALTLTCEAESDERTAPFAGLLLELPGKKWKTLLVTLDQGARVSVMLADGVSCLYGPTRKGLLLERPLDTRGSASVAVGLAADGKPVATVCGVELPLAAEPLAPIQAIPVLGAAQGSGRFTTIQLSLRARDTWLRKLDEEEAHVVSSELAKSLGNPDPVAIPAVALDPLAKLLVGLRASLEDDPARVARIADRAVRLAPRHAEARALRAFVALGRGQTERALEDALVALEERPDCALALLVRGTLRGDKDDLELATLLADDALLERCVSWSVKAHDGPWAAERTRRRLTPHYVILTDTDDETADAVAKVLEQGFAAFTREFGTPTPWTRGEVLVFNTRSAFLDWARFVLGEAGENQAGFYDAFHDQLCLYQPINDADSAWTKCVSVHEAFHHFAQRAFPGIPVWLNEGLAESFGLDAAYGGGASVRAFGLGKCLEKPFGKAEWRRFFRSSHADFHAGEHENYARSAVVAWLLREGDGPLAGVLGRFLAKVKREDPAAETELFTDVVLDALAKRFDPRARRALRR